MQQRLLQIRHVDGHAVTALRYGVHCVRRAWAGADAREQSDPGTERAERQRDEEAGEQLQAVAWGRCHRLSPPMTTSRATHCQKGMNMKTSPDCASGWTTNAR